MTLGASPIPMMGLTFLICQIEVVGWGMGGSCWFRYQMTLLSVLFWS